MKNNTKAILTAVFIAVSMIFITKSMSVVPDKIPPIVNINTNVSDVTHETSTNVSEDFLSTGKIPSRYDSREHGVVTSVKEQASDNCWAFAAISALESDYISQGFGNVNNTDFSESHLAWFSCNSISPNEDGLSQNEGRTVNNPYHEAGNWSVATAALARWSGIAKESTFPFPVERVDTPEALKEADRYVNDTGMIVKSVEQIPDDDIDAIKKWIIEHGSVCVSVYNQFENYYNGPAGYAGYYNGENDSNHQFVIIGWDDNFSVNNFDPECRPEKPGAWLCKDSQGPKWCNNGYSWVSYETESLSCFIGYTCQPAEKYDNNYTYNGFGWSAGLVCSNNSCAANVFKTADKEILKAVSFYTAQPDTTIQINVYADIADGALSPVSNNLIYASKEIAFANSGYHTVDLSSDVSMPANTTFSVVLKFTHESGKTQIPFETKKNNRNGTYVSNPGESFIYAADYSSQWCDPSAYGGCNVCIQAFTQNLT